MTVRKYIKYSENNSGGSWWLKDEDWKALEEAGWVVEYYKDEPFYSGTMTKDGRWLGSIAGSAKLYDTPLKLAIAIFEVATGQDANTEGCPCCGPPHNFYEYEEDVPEEAW